ncbi:MAG: penicillin acylase family protein, partial [Chloroflexi bacterium]|nr:penicillin acylase family protein [Chloroflexota bacterium]
EPVEERILVTRHGPGVSPAIGDGRAIALRSTVVEGGDMASPFLGLARARSLDDVDGALDGWPGATFNFVLASVDGEIGYRFAGRVPAREPGQGLLPQPGATSEGPPACVPPSALPRLRNPADGVIISANNAPGGELELGEEWCEPARWERLRGLVDARTTHDVASFAAMQNDRYSANLVRLRDLILQREAADDVVRTLLDAWDGHMNADSGAAAVMHLVYGELAHEITERLAGGHAALAIGGVHRAMPANSAFAYRSQGMHVAAAEDASAPWFATGADRDRALRGAVARAVERIAQECGSDVAAWSLGAVQRIPFSHALADVPGLGRQWSRGDRPISGDINTVLQAQGWPWRTGGTIRIAPGYRQVVDVGDWDRSVFMLPTGSSGIPGHPRYDDCIDEYLAGEYRPLLFSESAVRLAAESTLVLDPRSNGDTADETDGEMKA